MPRPARRASLQLVTAEEQVALAATPRISHVEATSLAFSPDGSLLAVGTNIGQVKLFNTSTGEVSQVFDDRSARLADKETPEIGNRSPAQWEASGRWHFRPTAPAGGVRSNFR